MVDMAKPRILIVDDTFVIRQLLTDMFSKLGLDVVGEAANGNEAVELYMQLKPDLVTMDIIMPLKSGLTAAKEILAIDPGASIIMCSALGQEVMVMEAFDVGIKDFIVKPIMLRDLRNVLSRVLGDKFPSNTSE